MIPTRCGARLWLCENRLVGIRWSCPRVNIFQVEPAIYLIKSSEWETVANINIISVLDWRWCKIVRFDVTKMCKIVRFGRAVLCKIVRFDVTKMCKIVRFGRAVLCKIEGIHEFKSKHELGGCLFF